MAKDKGDPLFEHAATFSGVGVSNSGSEPLASRMRPSNLDDFAGQEHIVGEGRLLRRAIQRDQLSSLIFSGPPGTGKTTLARVIANSTASRFVTLNAVLAGIADIRAAVEEAKRHRELYGRRTILFVDEVHRWNKAQQDALLPWVENGTIVLVGATTENPFFEVNKALVSRSRVFQLKPLGPEDLKKVATIALSDVERGYGRFVVSFEEGALEHLVATAEGDARNLLNALELAVETSVASWPPAEGNAILVTRVAAEESIQRRAVLYDKDGDYHYDAASAFIKSLRGSDPDAALYWLARMVYAGEDPRFIMRRMLISASEDIGLADPNALRFALAAAEAFERVGMPEGQFFLSEAALYLATAPKSNTTLSYFDAYAAVEAESADVPDHLKDANRDAKGFGHGDGYLYPHAYRDHWTAQQYLPDALRGRVFYKPGSLGLEGERRALVLERREAVVAAMLAFEASPDSESGASVWSKDGENKSKRGYRGDSGAPERLAILRKALYDGASPARHDRILVLDAREGYFVWEALRRAPEGTVVALVRGPREAELVKGYADTLAELEKPVIVIGSPDNMRAAEIHEAAGFSRFDLVAGRDLLLRAADPEAILERLAGEFSGAKLATVEVLPREGGRLSNLDLAHRLDRELATRFSAFEADFYASDEDVLGPDAATLRSAFDAASTRLALSGATCERIETVYSRNLSRSEIEAWFAQASAYGKAARNRFSEDEILRIAEALGEFSQRGPIAWPLAFLRFSALFPRREQG